MGVFWFIISLLISPIVIPVGLIYGLLKQCWKNGLKKALKDIDNKAMALAVSIDKFGNVACAELLNATLITSTRFSFGNHRQTISHVLGVNKRSDSLTPTGKKLVQILDRIDADHSVKSIEE